jgi:hypothetical protein
MRGVTCTVCLVSGILDTTDITGLLIQICIMMTESSNEVAAPAGLSVRQDCLGSYF